MIKSYKIPTPGESINEVEIASWLVEDGAFVNKNDELAEVESDKATLMLVAEESGVISIKVVAGILVAVGSEAYTIDTASSAPQSAKVEMISTPSVPVVEPDVKVDAVVEKSDNVVNLSTNEHVKVTPVAAEMMKENNLSVDDIINGLRRISKHEVEQVLSAVQNPVSSPEVKPILTQPTSMSRKSDRQKMTVLRKRLSEKLVAVKNETAMLTTFNEIDMSAVMNLRQSLQDEFVKKHGFKLGFMGFFTKAVSLATQFHPMVNASIDGDEIVVRDYADVGIAVQTPKGLMVPVVRNAESKSIVQIELDIKELAQKARNKKITIEELSGGTISITNGGVFGSLLSTPIINPPQSAILGMHNIVERPIAVNGQVVIRPMMYVALSYDHRIIDGKDSVGFLVKIKELIEHPERMVTQGIDPAKVLLSLV